VPPLDFDEFTDHARQERAGERDVRVRTVPRPDSRGDTGPWEAYEVMVPALPGAAFLTSSQAELADDLMAARENFGRASKSPVEMAKARDDEDLTARHASKWIGANGYNSSERRPRRWWQRWRLAVRRGWPVTTSASSSSHRRFSFAIRTRRCVVSRAWACLRGSR